MEKTLYEVRHALDRLRRTPGFTLAALITLALGIGANALIFGVVNAVFVRPLSYRDARRLVWASELLPTFTFHSIVLTPDYAAWKDHSTAFERLEAMGSTFGLNLDRVEPSGRARSSCPCNAGVLCHGRNCSARGRGL